MNKTIGIIGMGVVGQAMEELLKEHYDYYLYDKYKSETPDSTKKYINKCDVGIICVPTPMAKDGSCDTSEVEEVLGWLKTPLIIIKSTVPVGFTDDYILSPSKIVFSPEYIGESKYFNPIYKTMADTDFMVFGGTSTATRMAVEVFKPVMGPICKYIQCTSMEAEMAKYMENTFFATKIAFCQEFYDICEAYGVDYDTVREVWLNDQRINRMHTAVFENDRGFGGKCLPKDLSAIIESSKKEGYNPELLNQVKKENEKRRS